MNSKWELPPELANSIHSYIVRRSHSWKEEERTHLSRNLFSTLSVFFRSVNMTNPQIVTPKVWFSHVEARMRAGIKPSSLNTTLRNLQSFLRHLKGDALPICETILEVRPLKTGDTLPRDLTLRQAMTLLQNVPNPLDRGWILLMLQSGLRTCEVRSLRWSDVDLQARTLHIHESKGGQSRMVFLGPQTIQALDCLPRDSECVFIYRDQSLSRRYCQSRLTTMSRQCGFHITPHQLRHTCATMLLNAGMSILGVQRILGHKYVETTLRYARMYDVTVERDFKKAGSTR